jgi:2-amino-4-hydroxy-6-hydroxymethyldihydropteridine diphosphokinase
MTESVDHKASTTAYIGIGANLGNPIQQMNVALERIQKNSDFRLLKQSHWYRTAPWGVIDQPDFINGVIVVKTSLSAFELLEYLQALEREQGRTREGAKHWGPRLLDLDILLYGKAVIETDQLSIPHPYLKERAFVLYPLAEVAKDLILPTGESVEELKLQCATQEITLLEYSLL